MKTIHILFGLLVLMAVALGVICIAPTVPSGQGYDHANYPAGTIKQAPDGMQRHRPVIVAAGCFGTLTSLFVVLCGALGFNRHHRDGLGSRVLMVGGLGFAMLFSIVVVFYWQSLMGTSSKLFAFPSSTGWMLFVVMPYPLLLVLLYMATFSRWMVLPDDEARFHELVAKRRTEDMGHLKG